MGSDGTSICVIAAGEKSRDAIAGQLHSAGVRCVTISAQSNHSDARDAVHVVTMHRAKGLEFDAVVVVAPSTYLEPTDDTLDKRKLIYVALTRAKRAAMLMRLT